MNSFLSYSTNSSLNIVLSVEAQSRTPNLMQPLLVCVAVKMMPHVVSNVLEIGRNFGKRIFNELKKTNQVMQNVDPWRFPGVKGIPLQPASFSSIEYSEKCKPKEKEVMKNGNVYYTIENEVYGPYKPINLFPLSDTTLSTKFRELLLVPQTKELLKVETSTLCPLPDRQDLEPTETEGVLKSSEGRKFIKSGLAKAQFNEQMLANLGQDSLVTLTRTPAVSEGGSLLSFTEEKILKRVENTYLSNLTPAILAFIFIPSLHDGDSYKIEDKFLVLDTEGFSFSEQNIANFLPKSIAKQLLMELINEGEIYKTFKKIDNKLDSFLKKLETMSLQEEDTLLNALLSGVTTNFIDTNEQIIKSLCEHDKTQENLFIDIEQSITALKAALGTGDAKSFFYENHKKRITIFSKSIKTLLEHQEQDKRLNMWQVFAKYVYKELVESLVPLSSDTLVDFSDEVINSMTYRVQHFIYEHGQIEPQRVLSNILSHLEASIKLNPDLSKSEL